MAEHLIHNADGSLVSDHNLPKDVVFILTALAEVWEVTNSEKDLILDLSTMSQAACNKYNIPYTTWEDC